MVDVSRLFSRLKTLAYQHYRLCAWNLTILSCMQELVAGVLESVILGAFALSHLLAPLLPSTGDKPRHTVDQRGRHPTSVYV